MEETLGKCIEIDTLSKRLWNRKDKSIKLLTRFGGYTERFAGRTLSVMITSNDPKLTDNRLQTNQYNHLINLVIVIQRYRIEEYVPCILHYSGDS